MNNDTRYYSAMEEQINISHLHITTLGKQKWVEEFTTIRRCYMCHSLLPNDGNSPIKQHYLLREGDILKAICSKCLENKILNNGHMIICEGCGNKYHKLYNHHWYDPKDYSKCYSKQVCQFCNAKLTTINLWGLAHGKPEWMNHNGWYHILPNFELQKLYITNQKEYHKCRELEYPFPLSYPPWDK